jgi:hypothetical protein
MSDPNNCPTCSRLWQEQAALALGNAAIESELQLARDAGNREDVDRLSSRLESASALLALERWAIRNHGLVAHSASRSRKRL